MKHELTPPKHGKNFLFFFLELMNKELWYFIL